MRNYLSLFSILSLSFAATACTDDSDDDGDDAGTRVTGQAVYADSATDPNGNPQDPAIVVGTADLSIVVEGSGTISEIDPACALDPAGVFSASFLGTMMIDQDGAYAAVLGSGSGSVTTPSGCEIPDLEIGLVTDVVIRAELEANTTNCNAYCEASARASAEAECGATADAVDCRLQAAAEAEASCTATCTTESHVIVAEVSLAASLLAELDFEALQAAALGELHVDLVFDHME